MIERGQDQEGLSMKRLSVAAIAAAVYLVTSGQTAEAQCSLAGKWDGYLTLSQLGDDGERLSPTVARCIFTMLSNGQLLQPGVKCFGERAGEEYDVFMETFGFQVTSGCRLAADPELYFELQTELVQTQDIYQCTAVGTMERTEQAVHGLLDCGAEPTPFVLVRR